VKMSFWCYYRWTKNYWSSY